MRMNKTVRHIVSALCGIAVAASAAAAFFNLTKNDIALRQRIENGISNIDILISINDSEEPSPTNINSANFSQLRRINGISESAAKEIIAYRNANGYFRSVDELIKVKGIGEKTLEKIRNQVMV